MDLLEVKRSTRQSWNALAKASGIPRGNLYEIAHGTKGWGPETGEKLRRIGVDLNTQTEVYARKRAELAAAARSDQAGALQ